MNRLLARSLLVSIVLIHSRAAFSEGVEPPEAQTENAEVTGSSLEAAALGQEAPEDEKS